MTKQLRIVFMGTPEFAVPSLQKIAENGYDIAAVITSPDRPAGRGRKIKASPVKEYAVSKGLRLMQPENLKERQFQEELRALGSNLFVVVAFRMLPEAVWSMPDLGTFNLHASLLPQYRGAAPINHAIMNGEKLTGLTTFFLKQEIDTGEIIFRESTPIGPDETFGELHDRLKEMGAELVLKTLRAIDSGDVETVSQRALETGAPLSKAPKIFREDCMIDWTKPARDIYNKIRGLSPYPCAFTELETPEGPNHILKIYSASLKEENNDYSAPHLKTDGKSYVKIILPDGTLSLEEVQVSGKIIFT
jgi:methionyl-tRNA formyltransferase